RASRCLRGRRPLAGRGRVSGLRVVLERVALVVLGVALETLSMPPGPLPWLVFAADAPFLWLLWHRGGTHWKRWAYVYGVVKFAIGVRWLAEVHPAEVALCAPLMAFTYLAWGGAIRFLARARVPFPIAVAPTAVRQEMA